jgi:hypothetical protein
MAAGPIPFIAFLVQQVSYATELFRGGLESFDLLTYLHLLRLLLAQHFVNVPHGTTPLRQCRYLTPARQ